MAEPDLELGEGVGEVVLLALPAFLPSVISFSKPKIKKYIYVSYFCERYFPHNESEQRQGYTLHNKTV